MLTIADAARILRAYTGTHIRHVYINHKGGRCAIGILGGEELGCSVEKAMTVFQGSALLIGTRVGKCYGMSDDIVNDILTMNDNGASLHEIADKLDVLGGEA